ncbi:MAG: hypothetical protein LBE13_19580, partial [Bacteroidales bacterium]|nr:hypothetical protein [Bacteroidales bacterium]
EKTHGEYVYLIASDDKAAPEAIEKEYAFLSKNPDYALAVGANDIIDADGKRCFWDKNRNNVYDEKDAEWLSWSDVLMRFGDKLDFFSGDFGTYESLLYFENHIPNGYLIRKSIFDKIEKFTLDAPLEDYFLMLQISKHAKMKYLSDTLFYYRWHGTNATTKKDLVDITTRTQLHEIKDICPRIYHHILGLQAQYMDTQSKLIMVKEQYTDTQTKLAITQEQYIDAQNRFTLAQEEYKILENSRTYLAGKIVLVVPKMIKRLLFRKNKCL